MKVLTNKQYKQEKVAGHYFLDFSIENVRCYGKKQTLKLADEKGQPYHWTIILGDNGVGKTSLLKGLVSLAPSPKNIYGDKQRIKLYPGLYDWRDDWNTSRFEGAQKSVFEANTIAAHGFRQLVKDQQLFLRLEQGHETFNSILHNEAEYGRIGDFLCFAYGASRKMGRSSFTNEKYAGASISLFNDEAPLINVEEFFMQADYEAKTSRSLLSTAQRNKVKQLLLDVLPEVTDLRIAKSKRLGRYVEVKTPFGWVRISEMSLGYKSLIAWVVDFASRMYHYHSTKANPFAEPAVVLIDEIDLHLHPKWQRKVLGFLSKKFPNTQFIATAHSPLIVQAATEANIVLLKRRGTQVIINNDPEIVRNWRIDQVLTSDLFGLETARRPDVQKLMDSRKKILSMKNISLPDKAKLRKIEKNLGDIPEHDTPLERQAYSAIDKVAALLNLKAE
jgi:energy-coupling factor transporter ATP-binding protein EcfA2